MAKSWHEKLNIKREVAVEKIDKPYAGFPAGASMLIATPMVVKKFMDSIPSGKRILLPEMRKVLAKRYKADVMCPLTSGIFLRIVSEAAWDDLQGGAPLDGVTPFWRAIGPKDPVVKKLRCGQEFLEERWKAEGVEASAGEEHIGRVRRICSLLPGTTEKLSHGEPTFFAKKGVYAMVSNNHHGDGRIAVWIPLGPGEQEALVRARPKSFYRPPYVGVKGWVGIELREIGDDELGEFLSEAWKRMSRK